MSILKRITGLVSDRRALQAKAYVGAEFEAWKKTDVGRYLITKIEQEEVRLLRKIMEADPADKVKIVQAQERARLMTTLLGWIEGAINEGETAKYQMEEMEAAEIGY